MRFSFHHCVVAIRRRLPVPLQSDVRFSAVMLTAFTVKFLVDGGKILDVLRSKNFGQFGETTSVVTSLHLDFSCDDFFCFSDRFNLQCALDREFFCLFLLALMGDNECNYRKPMEIQEN